MSRQEIASRRFTRDNYDVPKALHYAQLAAEQAVGRAAYLQARSFIDSVLKLLHKTAGQRARPGLGAYRTQR
jgi:hypothetical protein